MGLFRRRSHGDTAVADPLDDLPGHSRRTARRDRAADRCESRAPRPGDRAAPAPPAPRRRDPAARGARRRRRVSRGRHGRAARGPAPRHRPRRPHPGPAARRDPARRLPARPRPGRPRRRGRVRPRDRPRVRRARRLRRGAARRPRLLRGVRARGAVRRHRAAVDPAGRRHPRRRLAEARLPDARAVRRRRTPGPVRAVPRRAPVLSVHKTTLRKADPSVGGAWHQDGAFMGDARALNLWLSLSRCGDLAPGLDLVPRRLDEIVIEHGVDARRRAAPGRRPARRPATWRSCGPIFEPGDALFFDEMFLHQTGSDPVDAEPAVRRRELVLRRDRVPRRLRAARRLAVRRRAPRSDRSERVHAVPRLDAPVVGGHRGDRLGHQRTLGPPAAGRGARPARRRPRV